MVKNPYPTVTFEGNTYKLRSRNIEIPELEKMDKLAALVWINQNTFPRGYQKKPNPLIGFAGAITLK